MDGDDDKRLEAPPEQDFSAGRDLDDAALLQRCEHLLVYLDLLAGLAQLGIVVVDLRGCLLQLSLVLLLLGLIFSDELLHLLDLRLCGG